ncbi:ABC transporter substrate-binding protein [Paenibacillus kyungheensis]|uniref:ABC transporter substrate-binding protein n=1 Tax=Paenibacillus kyungheensis TaxID=1452732 RepID=A0AAX3LW73_9BACL|nr:ABC transporter substrate-binding protein [Paenibacillus kyungheensis]WCT53943.1 ABC transporter substrate-binding protein [Paenibacillus kyungheensis]
MLTKVLNYLILLVLITVMLAGCASNSKNVGSSGKTKIVFWAHQESAMNDAYHKLIQAYEAKHPDIEIDFQTFPYDVYNQKLKASFSAQNPPDVAEMFGTWVPEYSKNGALTEVPNIDKISKEYYPAPLGAYQYNGKLYGLPLEYNLENGGMLIHPEMFKNKGLEYPPKTWDDLVENAKILTVRNDNGIQIKGFDFISLDNITFTFLSMILQQNGKYWGTDNHVSFQTPEAIQAMNALTSLVSVDKVTDLSVFGGQLDSSDYFFRGNSAMTYRGPWTVASGLDNYKVKDFEYVPVPSFTNENPYFAAESGWGVVVASKSEIQKQALNFIQFLSENENLLQWNISTFTVPPKKEVANNPKFLKENPYMKAPLDILKYGQWIGPVADRDYFFKQINDNFQLIVSGQITVETGLSNIEQSINSSQDQHK